MASVVRFGIRGGGEPVTSNNLHPTNHPDRVDRIVIVGNGGDCHVGAHFMEAAKLLGWESQLVDIEKIRASKWRMRVYWRLLGRRDPRAGVLKRRLNEACDRFRPNWVLVTGRIPIDTSTIQGLQRRGVRMVNFMTDDPWNPLYRARWLREAMKQYDTIFTPRRSNIGDFEKLGSRQVVYLPFAYSSSKHEAIGPGVCEEDFGDILFVGGADSERVVYARALQEAGLKLILYGGFWDRFPDLRGSWRGMGTLETIRTACLRSKVTLVLPRHANRDGHVMRSYESAASRSCILAEGTGDHLAMYGDFFSESMQFNGLSSMVTKAQLMVQNKDLRDMLRATMFDRIVRSGANTYQSRLNSMALYLSNARS